jgi:hypothetical protein
MMMRDPSGKLTSVNRQAVAGRENASPLARGAAANLTRTMA